MTGWSSRSLLNIIRRNESDPEERRSLVYGTLVTLVTLRSEAVTCMAALGHEGKL